MPCCDHGYAVAHAELREWTPDAHAWDCDCEPCISARAVLRAVKLAATLNQLDVSMLEYLERATRWREVEDDTHA